MSVLRLLTKVRQATVRFDFSSRYYQGLYDRAGDIFYNSRIVAVLPEQSQFLQRLLATFAGGSVHFNIVAGKRVALSTFAQFIDINNHSYTANPSNIFPK